MDEIPRLYVIADAETLARRGLGLREFAGELLAAGVRLVQWRCKGCPPQEVLAGAEVLRSVLGDQGLLVMNDRVDLALLAGFGGVHVGQGDLSPADAKAVAGTHSSRWSREEWGTDRWGGEALIVGVSTHSEEQVRVADAGPADYVAVGPVFATGTKADAAPVVGLDGVRRARALTAKPLVAIGGITRENARSVIDAGADSVAVISALFAPGESVAKVARDFLELLR